MGRLFRLREDAVSSYPVIAIDGPAGAGKSTVARQLAKRLGFFLLDTGAIYRCLALFAEQQGIGWDQGVALAALAANLPIRFGREAEDGQVFLADLVVTGAIRTPEISLGASQVSAHPPVRGALLGLQRRLATMGPCVVEGRDIGTVVLPGALLKLFLTASSEVRAQRRFEELTRRGVTADREATRRDQEERDRRDETREAAPLRIADDAVVVDTSELALPEVLDKVESLCRQRISAEAEQSGAASSSSVVQPSEGQKR